MKKILIVICLLVNIACKIECKENILIKNRFNSSLNTLKYCHSGHSCEDNELIDAIIYLDSLTKYSGHIYMGQRVYYSNLDSLDYDIKVWKEWYEKNKCKLSR